MTGGFTRRHWLKGAAAAFAATGCDRLDVDIQPKPGGFATPDGVAPVTPNAGHYVYQYGAAPEFDVSTWSCPISTSDGVQATLDVSVFEGLTPIEIEHTLQCIGGSPRNALISNAVWGGLPFEDVLADLGVDWPDSVVEIIFRGADDYHTSIPVADLENERVWIVWEMNGEPLPAANGAPCRFLVIGRYGTKNVKWPVEITFSNQPYTGYWEGLDWSKDATYQVNGYIFNPLEGSLHDDGVRIFGTAYGGMDAIERVDITFDDGETWEPATLTYSPGANRWTLWEYVLSGASGEVTARVRVTAASGAQTTTHENLDQLNGYDGGMQVVFRVDA